MPEIDELTLKIETIANLRNHGLNAMEIVEYLDIDRDPEIVKLVACIVQLLETTIPKT